MRRFRIAQHKIPLLATIVVCVALYALGAYSFEGFFTARVFIDLLVGDSAVLGIAAVGMTFVILSGGIDLSVGAVVGLVSIVSAVLLERRGWSAALVVPLVLGIGVAFGVLMGCLIRFFDLPPFLVTLAGMFLARGLAFTVSLESLSISSDAYMKMAEFQVPLGSELAIPSRTLAFLIVLAIAVYAAHWSRFGRNVYAIGGNEEAAKLMGLPVGPTKISVYAVSGFCSALAGLVYTVYTLSGNPTAGTGLELDAIAAVVIGGTLLTGGVGYMFGTFVGVLIFGIIQTGITFQGTLSSWWTRIVIGLLLLGFILLQRLLARNRSTHRA